MKWMRSKTLSVQSETGMRFVQSKRVPCTVLLAYGTSRILIAATPVGCLHKQMQIRLIFHDLSTMVNQINKKDISLLPYSVNMSCPLILFSLHIKKYPQCGLPTLNHISG